MFFRTKQEIDKTIIVKAGDVPVGVGIFCSKSTNPVAIFGGTEPTTLFINAESLKMNGINKVMIYHGAFKNVEVVEL